MSNLLEIPYIKQFYWSFSLNEDNEIVWENEIIEDNLLLTVAAEDALKNNILINTEEGEKNYLKNNILIKEIEIQAPPGTHFEIEEENGVIDGTGAFLWEIDDNESISNLKVKEVSNPYTYQMLNLENKYEILITITYNQIKK